MNTRRIFTVFGAVAACALALVACRAEEQGRITRYKPGVYLGKKDAQLSEAQKQVLGERAASQGDSNYRAPGGGAPKAVIDSGALGSRAQKQGGTTP